MDAATWNYVAVNLNSGIEAIVRGNETIIGTHAGYTIVQVGITVGYTIPYIFLTSNYSGNSVNLPFIWFIVATFVNLSLLWYSGTKRINEPTKNSKTKTIIPSEQKDKLRVQK